MNTKSIRRDHSHAAASVALAFAGHGAWPKIAVLVRPEPGVAGAARRVRRQQLAPGDHGIGRGRGREVPQHHPVRICRRSGRHAEGHLGHQVDGRQGHQCAGGVRRRRPGRAAGPHQRLSRPAPSSCPTASNVGGKEGENYTKFIGSSFVNDGVSWGNWIKDILPEGGNVLFLSAVRPATARVSTNWQGLKTVLDDKYVFVNPEPFAVTNWDPALTQQVLTAEIAKNDKIDVIVSDFGPSLVGALPVFDKFSRVDPGAWRRRTATRWPASGRRTRTRTPTSSCSPWRPATTTSVLPCSGPLRWRPAARRRPRTSSRRRSSRTRCLASRIRCTCRPDLPGSIYLSAELSDEEQAKAVGQ